MLFIAQKNLKQKLKKAVLILLGIYIMVGTAFYVLQERFLFLPEILPQDHTYSLTYDYDEYFLNAPNEGVINTVHIKANNPQGVILYFHGNAGSLKRWSKIAEYFVAINYDVYIMDYRTYGKSKGTLSEEALYEDAQACYNHLKQFWTEDNITVYGRSLGSAMATKMAATNNPKQLILETPFYNIADVAKSRFPMFPVKKLLKYQFSNNEHIKNVSCVIHIVHGTNDKVVPFSSGEKLFKTLKSKKATLTIVENGGHNNLVDFNKYNAFIKEILK
ncbi:alpha/beta hydrolase [Pontimicrobium aquaticum]|uniref:Alpha/beta hydrolase n=1 Tax=Pontimicrobium aquaticum TaxID=2565367 RepID=A0A4U0EK27_9FLAO|nr:alpha/beta fold hydrolase [Pontimicrobium aquaticum]TJY31843.1 alpha/beta hydrolase [Pontimicrobium aquaticum]